MPFGLLNKLKSLVGDRSGNILITSALAMPVMIGMVALVGEYGGAVLNRVESQRVADLAAYAGATAYGAKNTVTAMQSAAYSVGSMNGIPQAQMTVALVASPRTASTQAVSVTIANPRTLFLSRVLSTTTSLTVRANSLVELGSTAAMPGCILALSGSETGVTLSGGTTLTASLCSVSSNNTITVPCGTYIKALSVNYNSTGAPTVGCGGIQKPDGTAASANKTATTDPLAGNAAVTTATNRIATVAAVVAPTAPTAPTVATGSDINFAYDNTDTKSPRKEALAQGCTATYTTSGGNTWTFTCPSTKKTVNLGNLTLGGGIELKFATTGGTDVTYNFSGNITTANKVTFGPGTYNIKGTLTTAGTTVFGAGTYNIGGAVTLAGTTTFGAGTFNLAAGLTTGGGSTTTFGAGTFKMGQSAVSCSGATYSICHTGTTLTFGGPSTFELRAGFMNGGGSTLVLGSGTANSYKLGASSGGAAIKLGGGSKTTMADATGNNSVFEVAGHIDGGGGGSCFIIPAAAQHDINGNFIASGAIWMGAGVYTVDGYMSFGAAGGGGATCNGQTISVYGVDVTLVISGKATPSSGSCSGYSFCVAAGYSGVTIKAPTSGTYAKLAVVGPTQTGRTAGATFAEGGSNGKISGAFYFPLGPFIMNGGSSVMGNGANECLQIIGSRVTLSGGTAAASECIAASGASVTKKAVLVQ